MDVSPIERFGFSDPTYRAFSYLDAAGCCIANAAIFSLPLIIDGQAVAAMGVQSVATRPAWRRQGLSHDLLARALAWCDAHPKLTFLMTGIPQFYEPLGFRIVPQFAFTGRASAASAVKARRLDLAVDADCSLLATTLRGRTPVSTRFAVDGAAGAFILSLCESPSLSAWYLDAHQAVVVTLQRPGGVLAIVDVAAARMPSLAQIVSALGTSPGQVEIHFPPDRLGWTGTAVPAPVATSLMVRGALPPVGPFMLPQTAAF